MALASTKKVHGDLIIFIYLKICLTMEETGDDMHMEFPIVCATMPYHVPHAPSPSVYYGHCSLYVEGGMYISPEFQLGQVYDGTTENDDIILYRPTYVFVKPEQSRYIREKPSTSRAPPNGTSSSAKETSNMVATLEKDQASTSKVIIDGVKIEGGQSVKSVSSVQKQSSKTKSSEIRSSASQTCNREGADIPLVHVSKISKSDKKVTSTEKPVFNASEKSEMTAEKI